MKTRRSKNCRQNDFLRGLFKSCSFKSRCYSRDNAGMASISDLSDKILETFSDLQDIQISHEVKKDKNIKQIIVETKKNMMIVLIIGFLGTIVLGLVVLERLLFLSRKSTMRLESFKIVNFDVSIFYNQEDEIGEIARR